MVKIVSYANQYNVSGFVNFKNSIKKCKWNYKLIGKNEKWEGWITRMRAYRNFASRLNSNELIVLLDAYDVICIKEPKGFEEEFNKLGVKYIFGSERSCAENITCKKPHKWQDKHRVYDHFVNGGCIVSRSKDIFKLYDWCIRNHFTRDDQIALGHFMNEHADDVLLDINSTFVFNDLFGTTADIRIDNGKIKILNSKNQPYFIHFPGLMIFNSFPMQVDIGKTPENYITVTRTTLGDEAIFNLPINNTFYNFYLIIIYSIIILLIIILCSFLIFYIIRLKQCRNKK